MSQNIILCNEKWVLIRKIYKFFISFKMIISHQPPYCEEKTVETGTKIIEKMKANFNSLGDWFAEHEVHWRKN